MGIAVEKISRHYGSFHAVDDVSLEIKTGSGEGIVIEEIIQTDSFYSV